MLRVILNLLNLQEFFCLTTGGAEALLKSACCVTFPVDAKKNTQHNYELQVENIRSVNRVV